MIKKAILSVIYFIVIQSFSQSMFGYKAMDIPQDLILPTANQKDVNFEKLLPGNIWTVYSDRPYNQTSRQAGKNNIFKILNYLDKFYVLEKKKDFLHIVKDPKISSDGSFSELSEDYGWISIDRLLIWEHCLINDNNLNSRVVLFRNSYNHQVFSELHDNNSDEKYFQIAYIYKIDKERVLLGKDIRLSGVSENLSNLILGWFNLEQITILKTNTFLEPNINVQNSLNNKKQKYNTPVFSDKKSIKRINLANELSDEKLIWAITDVTNIPANFFRFPLLNLKDSIAEVMVFIPAKEFQFGIYNNNLIKESIVSGYCSTKKSNGLLSFSKTSLQSKAELLSIINYYDQLISIANIDPNNLQEFFNDQLKYINPNQKTTIHSLASLLKYKFGCFTINQFNNISIEEFIKRTEDINNYIDLLRNNLMNLNEIFNNNSSISTFYSNEIQYYWIPCQLIQ